jgi:hypothetical protein
MTRTFTALADRLVGFVAPKATAQAACAGCFEKFCYCQGLRLYTQSCCYLGAHCRRECGNCRYVGNGC